MKELDEYKQKLVNRLEQAAKEFREACLKVKDPYAPLEAGGWNTHQVAAHTRDVDKLVYGSRLRRTLAEENPKFPNFDGDTYMKEHYDAKEPLKAILDEIVMSIEEQAKLLRGLKPEDWSRLSRHETQGEGLTLQVWAERGLEHLEEHLKTVRK